jgi:hypothetical protein
VNAAAATKNGERSGLGKTHHPVEVRRRKTTRCGANAIESS